MYFTPENLISSKKWREFLLGDLYSGRLQFFAIDEAHTVVKWLVYCKFTFVINYTQFLYRGETFRKLLLRIGEIRSLLPDQARIMALGIEVSLHIPLWSLQQLKKYLCQLLRDYMKIDHRILAL